VVRFTAIKNNLDKSLDLFTDVVLNPVFPQSDLSRIKKEQLLAIKQEQTEPFGMAFRVLPKLIYGDNHAYSNPLSGTGTEASINQIDRNDLIQYHQRWFSPSAATLLVVGDVSESELKQKFEAKLKTWSPKPIPTKNIANVSLPDKPKIFIMDKPDAIQSVILAGHVGPSAKAQDWMQIQMMNKILGGDFTSRINMNLREDKHWSYGSGSYLEDAQGPGMFVAYAPVQTDKTKESIVELKKELEEYLDKRPVTAEEFSKSKQDAVMQLPGRWETNNSVLYALEEQVKYQRGDTYWNNYAKQIQEMTSSEIMDAAKKLIKPSQMTWLIIGDRKKIEQGIKDLKIGDVRYITPEGKIIDNTL
ncbi:MAG TPA: pitrilysin family protein, partial [Flavisolibacter sp.]|nr:pitrilysin family protein [Flavisolibacter sp.]